MKRLVFATAFVALIAGLYFMTPLAKAAGDLVAYWKFDETSGSSAADSSGTGNDGTLLGGVTQSTTVPPVSCFNDPRSLHFDGNSGSYVNVPDAASMDPANQISLALWIKPEVLPVSNFQHILFKKQNNNPLTSYGLWLTDSGTIYFESNDGSVEGLLGTTALTLNTWHYIAATYDGTTQKIFVDGVLDNSVVRPGITIGYGGYPLKIGDGDFNLPFQGNIDDVRVYDRGLSDNEITDLAGGGCGPNVAAAPAVTPAATVSPAAVQTSPLKAPNTGLKPKSSALAIIAIASGAMLLVVGIIRYSRLLQHPA